MSLSRFSLVLLCITLASCSNGGYFWQATKGQLSILNNRQSIERLLADPALESQLRNKLSLVNEIRDFATNELALPGNRSYRTYSETGKPYAVWNVVAAPEFSMSLKTWCFPIAGCIAYKGYFNKPDAEKLNQQLLDQNYDTFLYGVSAYSTLGWFADPVLDTFIDYREPSLANLIFHELAHQVVYVNDDSGFNEAFATSVGNAGMRNWMKSRYPDKDLSILFEQQSRNTEITKMVLRFRQQLVNLYADSAQSKLAERKQAVFQALRNEYKKRQDLNQGTPYYDGWFSLNLNNAHLSSVATYHDRVAAFDALLKQSDDFESFYQSVAELAKRSKPERDARIESYLDSIP